MAFSICLKITALRVCPQLVIDGVLYEWGENLALLAGLEWNDAWVGMFGDVLLRRLILRFLLCRAALTLHRDYGKIDDLQPTCFPPFPKVCPGSAYWCISLAAHSAEGCFLHMLSPSGSAASRKKAA